ncbi:porin [Pseudoduganella ginsengisoli]
MLLRSLSAALALACCAPLCHAQLTVHGSIAAAIRSSTHTDPAGHGKVEMTPTNASAQFIGFKGEEALGDGMRARFRLDAGFFTDTGATRHGALFGREASVGLDGRWGTVDAGRLQIIGGAVETLVRVDPVKGAGQVETVWPGIWTGARFDNAVRYRYDMGPWFAGGMVSVGERTGNRGQLTAISAGYLDLPRVAMASCQAAHDGAGLKASACTAGIAWTVPRFAPDGTLVHAAVLTARREKGFVVGAAGQALSNMDFSYVGIPAPAESHTRFGLLGITLPLTAVSPLWRLRSAVFYARTPDATLFSAREGGTQRAAYAVLSYDFSRRTALLFSVDWNHWSGGWRGYWGSSAASQAAYAPDGADTRRTASIGLQHTF